jgi:(p)ppGpp synthase/HD superfamily hydrolase
LVFNPTGPDFREIHLDLEVRDIQHLNVILAQLRGKSVVSKVERISG